MASRPLPDPPGLATNAAFAVGDRVGVKGKGWGIVRFVGPHHLEGTPRLGVELDGPTGKNDGTVKGHKYFSCPPRYGALVKPDKATVTAPMPVMRARRSSVLSDSAEPGPESPGPEHEDKKVYCYEAKYADI